MSCNCSSIKQVENVLNNYKVNAELPKGTAAERIKYYATNLWLNIYGFFDTIVLIGYLVYKYFSKDKRISIAKMYFKEK